MGCSQTGLQQSASAYLLPHVANAQPHLGKQICFAIPTILSKIVTLPSALQITPFAAASLIAAQHRKSQYVCTRGGYYSDF